MATTTHHLWRLFSLWLRRSLKIHPVLHHVRRMFKRFGTSFVTMSEIYRLQLAKLVSQSHGPIFRGTFSTVLKFRGSYLISTYLQSSYERVIGDAPEVARVHGYTDSSFATLQTIFIAEEKDLAWYSNQSASLQIFTAPNKGV